MSDHRDEITRVPNLSWFALACPTNGTLALLTMRTRSFCVIGQQKSCGQSKNMVEEPHLHVIHGPGIGPGCGIRSLKSQVKSVEVKDPHYVGWTCLKHLGIFSIIFSHVLIILSFETGARTARVSMTCGIHTCSLFRSVLIVHPPRTSCKLPSWHFLWCLIPRIPTW